MSWQHWIVVGWFALRVILAPTRLREPQKPFEVTDAAWIAAVGLAAIGLIVWGNLR